MELPRGYENEGARFDPMSRGAVEEGAMPSSDDVDLVTCVRLLRIVTDWRVKLGFERSASEDWHGEIAWRRRSFRQGFREADVNGGRLGHHADRRARLARGKGGGSMFFVHRRWIVVALAWAWGCAAGAGAPAAAPSSGASSISVASVDKSTVTVSSKTTASDAATAPETSASERTLPSATSGADKQLAALRTQLGERAAEIESLKTQLSKTQTDLTDKEADRLRLAQQRADLSQQLELASANLESVQQKLNSLTNQGSQDSARRAALDQKVNELTASIGERDQEIARERELLDKDRDIRELMSSRDLYIAEVYDVAKTGDTQKPFGRVFYTSGKSLIFYAYDLDQQPGIERTSTFQAWGRRGPDRDHAVNLGILYEDNANKKRWVLKSNNPKTLEQIDAVFVTVEPNGGSPHPSGKSLLFAYLRIHPNHP